MVGNDEDDGYDDKDEFTSGGVTNDAISYSTLRIRIALKQQFRRATKLCNETCTSQLAGNLIIIF